MAKKVVSFAPHKNKLTKPRTSRHKLKRLVKKIFNYMKSDTYLFAPIVDPQSHAPSSSLGPGEVSCEVIKKKMVENVEDYLRSDCYLYAPILMNSVHVSSSPTSDEMKRRTEETIRYNHLKQYAVEHILLQRESVKHVVHQKKNIGRRSPRLEKVSHIYDKVAGNGKSQYKTPW